MTMTTKNDNDHNVNKWMTASATSLKIANQAKLLRMQIELEPKTETQSV